MAVGVGLAFVDVNILFVAVAVGLCTFTMVTLGIMAGQALGTLIGKRAEMAGGVILILAKASVDMARPSRTTDTGFMAYRHDVRTTAVDPLKPANRRDSRMSAAGR